MAKQEENLKKVNDDLEMMSDDELDNVAGGLPGFINANSFETYVEVLKAKSNANSQGVLEKPKEYGDWVK